MILIEVNPRGDSSWNDVQYCHVCWTVLELMCSSIGAIHLWGFLVHRPFGFLLAKFPLKVLHVLRSRSQQTSPKRYGLALLPYGTARLSMNISLISAKGRLDR